LKCFEDLAALVEEEVALETKIMERSSELKSANEKLAEAVHDLSARAQSFGGPKECMISELIHELGSPIGNASLIIESMEEKLDSSIEKTNAGRLRKSDLSDYWVKTKEACRQLDANLKRASDVLISYKSSGGHGENGTWGGDCEMFGVDDVVASVLESMQPTLEAACVVASWVGSATHVKISGLKGAFEQILVNLIANAIHHGCSGRKNGRIELSGYISTSKTQGDSLILSVADDGRGILPAHAKRLFEPYFTTRAGLGGTGLGLHLSRRMVRSMFSGDLTAKNKEPNGACFSMVLPIQPSRTDGIENGS
jgi:signal transduction histidine kinase